MMMKMITGERDRSFYNDGSNWRRENYSAEAEGRLSSPSPVRFEKSFLLFQKDDLRPVSGTSNETLVIFFLIPPLFLEVSIHVDLDLLVFFLFL
jgi:hypothetical protein